MQALTFVTTVNAPRALVWNARLDTSPKALALLKQLCEP